jgi:hypothetical protein
METSEIHEAAKRIDKLTVKFSERMDRLKDGIGITDKLMTVEEVRQGGSHD